MKGKLYLLPAPLGEEDSWIPEQKYLESLKDTRYIIAEKAKKARRDLRKYWPEINLSNLHITELNKRTGEIPIKEYIKPLLSGENMILISEAGCPGIADPGAVIVAEAQRQNIFVQPITGPSSILLALISSGMNGQSFCFHGYLPIKRDSLRKKIRTIEREVVKNGSSQLFIETPYRNLSLLEMLCKVLHPSTQLCIAANLNANNPFIKTMEISHWKQKKWDEIHKIPAVFILGTMVKRNH